MEFRIGQSINLMGLTCRPEVLISAIDPVEWLGWPEKPGGRFFCVVQIGDSRSGCQAGTRSQTVMES
jgi:hypothetical protein